MVHKDDLPWGLVLSAGCELAVYDYCHGSLDDSVTCGLLLVTRLRHLCQSIQLAAAIDEPSQEALSVLQSGVLRFLCSQLSQMRVCRRPVQHMRLCL